MAYRMAYQINWNRFKTCVEKIADGTQGDISFETSYRAVYNLTLNFENRKRFERDLPVLIDEHWQTFDKESIACLNDVISYYTKTTGQKIALRCCVVHDASEIK